MVEPEFPKRTIAEALICFAGNGKLEQRHDALTELIASKFLPKNADDQGVKDGLALLLKDASEDAVPGNRLLAIADAMRLSQVVQRWLPEISKGLEPAFQDELPPLRLLPGEGKDRRNVARACALFERDWMREYAANSIADEKDAERARQDFVELLLQRSVSIADALQQLSKCFAHLRPTTEAPADSVAKRLTRTLAALRTALIDSEREAGFEPGKALLALLADAFKFVGKPQDEKAIAELSAEVVLSVHDIVRTRISVIADPSMYLAVAYCRQLCGRTWPDELRKPLDQLIKDVCEAILLLGRQGMQDQGLLDQLNILCKYPERARTLANELAVNHPELPEDVRDWLQFGRTRTLNVPSASAIDAAASNADAAIGLSLQTARQARRTSEGLRERLISSLEIFEPSLVSSTEECLHQLVAVAVQVEQAAALRQLDLFGIPGAEIEMLSKYFNTLGDLPRQRMFVRQPAVIRKRNDGSIGEVVVKGLVD